MSEFREEKLLLKSEDLPLTRIENVTDILDWLLAGLPASSISYSPHRFGEKRFRKGRQELSHFQKHEDEAIRTVGGKVFNPEAYCNICQAFQKVTYDGSCLEMDLKPNRARKKKRVRIMTSQIVIAPTGYGSVASGDRIAMGVCEVWIVGIEQNEQVEIPVVIANLFESESSKICCLERKFCLISVNASLDSEYRPPECLKEFCNKYYLATHRAAKHGYCSQMLSSQSGVDLSALGRGADTAPSVDIQQLMMGLDQSTLTGNNALRSLYLSQMGMGGGSPSPSSVPSSGSASITGGSQDAGPEPSPKASTPTPQSDNSSGLPNWFSGLLPPQLQQQGLSSNMNTLLEQMQAMQSLQLFGGNIGSNVGALAAALSQNPASFLANSPNKKVLSSQSVNQTITITNDYNQGESQRFMRRFVSKFFLSDRPYVSRNSSDFANARAAKPELEHT
ncbi:hypothetical protein DICVIV_05547 [Dictyocaulus viviparus]|uniref:C2H2-type domain-containing protein n=1 Tax=Dictyocaulus viviparus TaxID=29172 RepID=A0A0D8Y198_DICVI|nr:hypothetical protein DICVIV_05547 [Dictyocaulus viviparus]